MAGLYDSRARTDGPRGNTYLDKKVSDLEEIRVELRDSGIVMAGLEISKVLDWESIRDLTCRTAEPGLTPPPHRHY